MLIKIAERAFYYCISFEFTDFVGLNRSYLFKGVNNLFNLSSYSTYPGYFLYIEHTKTKGNDKMSEIR